LLIYLCIILTVFCYTICSLAIKILDVVWLVNVRDFEMLDDNSILLDKDLAPSNNIDNLTNIFMDQMDKFRY
jgi:hypothetical protein